MALLPGKSVKGDNMLYFSSLLKTTDTYKSAAEQLFATLTAHGVPYKLLDNTCDIWLRDFMPVKTKSGKYISFRYEPSYLKDYPELRTDFRKEIAPSLSLENLVYSDINLDGGNIVFSIRQGNRRTASNNLREYADY